MTAPRGTARERGLVVLLAVVLAGFLGASTHFLASAPILGATTAWDETAKVWKVASTQGAPAGPSTPSPSPSPSLQVGDVVKRVGALEAGYLLLLTDNIGLEDRAQALEWFAAKRALWSELRPAEERGVAVPVEVERDGQRLVVAIHPRSPGLAFLAHVEVLHFLVGLAFFLVGAVAFVRGPRTDVKDTRVVFFLLCMSMTATYVTNATSLLAESVYEPGYFVLMNLTNMVNFFLAPALLLHFALLLPRKRRFLQRWPGLVVAYYGVCAVVAAFLLLHVINLLVAVFFTLSLVAIVQAFVSFRGPVEKQQMKWVAAGFGLGVGPWVLLNGVPLLITGQRLMNDTIPGSFFLFIPLCMAFAMHKHRLLDVDALFEGTFVYLLTLLVVGVVDLGLLALFSTRFGRSLELEPGGRVLVQVALVVGLYAPVRDRVRQALARLFRRQPRDDLAVLRELVDGASGKPPGDVLARLEAVVTEAYRPKVVAWARRGDPSWAPALHAFEGHTEPFALWEERALQETLPRQDLLVGVPIHRDDDVPAVLFLGELPRRRAYRRTDMVSLAALGEQASILYDNAILFEENARQYRASLDAEKERLDERESLLRELHDGLGSITTGIGLLADAGKNAGSPEEARRALGSIYELSRESMAEIRGFLRHLDVRPLTWPILAGELGELGRRVLEPQGITFVWGGDVSSGSLDDRRPTSLLAFHLHRIVSEAIANAAKHARARRVWGSLEVKPGPSGDRVVLRVADDGEGLAPAAVPKATLGLAEEAQEEGGRGLPNLRRRAEILGGRLVVGAAAEGGVEVRLELTRPNA